MTKEEYFGKTVGIYTVLGVSDRKDYDGHILYNCKCNTCGYIFEKRWFDISKANTCTHLNSAGMLIQKKEKWQNKKLQRVFVGMVDRCYNKNDKNYKWYGQKGVRICNEWMQHPELFEQWALSSGYKNSLTIDRIDSSKDYSPDNCQWLSMAENTRRAGKVNWITVGDETLTGKQWAARLGIGTNTINNQIREHGFDATKELIAAMLKEPPLEKIRKPCQTWFSVYNIKV